MQTIQEPKKKLFILQENAAKQKIGDYVIEKTVGQGTFGKVKLGTHVLTGEKVAVKILQKNKILDEADRLRIYREIKILKQLKHPNLIQLYEIIENKADIYLIMEYATHGELYEHIVKNKKLHESEAFFFFQQILSGVEYLHKLSISHRDLKLENLLLTYNNTIKIVDFGLSNFYDTNPLLLTSCGSPCYAAPEMILGQKYNGLKSDLWSLGIILFAMTCGYLPFENKDTCVMYRKVVKGEYEIPKHVSEEIKILIKGLLTVDPMKRFSIEDVKKCSWYTKLKSRDDNKGVIVGTHEIPVDGFILDVLENFNVSKSEAESHLRKNHHNRYTSLYYLLLEKYIREGGKSIADINVADFSPKTLKGGSIENSAEKTKRKFEETGRSPTGGQIMDRKNEKIVSPTHKNFPDIKNKIETSPPASNHLKQNSLDLSPKISTLNSDQKTFAFQTNESISLNSPQINKINNNFLTSQDTRTEANTLITEKPFVGFQSDRFDQTIPNKNGETIMKLENVLKEKKLGSNFYEKMKAESNSTKNSQLKQMFKNPKSNKSQSFYQTKFLIPQPIHLPKNTNNNNNSTNSSSITPKNAKSFHQKSQSIANKEKKVVNGSPKKKINETTLRNSKSKSIENNENPSKKILNVTLMALRKSNKSFLRNCDDKREKSISIEKIKENIDKILSKDKNPKTNKSSNNDNMPSRDNSPAFFSNESTNKKTNVSPINTSENNRKSYYQLAYLLKDKTFATKYNSNNQKDDRSRFKSMYAAKTEVSNQRQTNECSINNISQKKSKIESSDRSRSNSRSQSQIKKKIECQLNSLKMFTLTKREKENQNQNQNKTEQFQTALERTMNFEENKSILGNLKSPKMQKETKKNEKNLINIENFLRYSQKFRDLKAMQKDLEKLITKI